MISTGCKKLVLISTLTLFAVGYSNIAAACQTPIECFEESLADIQESQNLLDQKIAEIDELRESISQLENSLKNELNAVRQSIPTSVSISSSIQKVQGFGDSRNWKEIPDSQGATFCGLARVDDDSPQGSCEIGRNNGRWMYRTGGGTGDNSCAARCFKLSGALD